MDIQKLLGYNPWWREKEAIASDYDIERWEKKRYKWVPKFVNEVKIEPFALHILLGPRQAGKTTVVKLLIRNMLKKRNEKSIFYFNCEELSDFKELMDVIESYLHYRESSDIKSSLIILDEVTSPKEWYRAIKVLIDRGKLRNDVIILTGSTSIAIKREVELFPGRRGKGKDFILMPLSFREFLGVINPKLHGKIKPIENFDELEKKSTIAMTYFNELNKELMKYMNYGGFPLSIEAIDGSKEEAKKAYLSWIKTAILKIGRSDTIAKQILRAMLEKMPSAISWEAISKEIEVKSPKTVAAYVDILKSMFSLIVLYSIDISGKKIKFGRNKKIHLIDPFLLELFENWCFIKIKNKESILAESLVASHLSRIFQERIFFWKNGFEIDAIILENDSLIGFEVKWAEKPKAKHLSQLKKFIIITKKNFSTKPLSIPLSVFLSLLET